MGEVTVTVRDAQGVNHRLAPELLPVSYLHRRALCHRWFTLGAPEAPAPVTCLWCVAGRSRFGGSDG